MEELANQLMLLPQFTAVDTNVVVPHIMLVSFI
jgi:hypothetical protein